MRASSTWALMAPWLESPQRTVAPLVSSRTTESGVSAETQLTLAGRAGERGCGRGGGRRSVAGSARQLHRQQGQPVGSVPDTAEIHPVGVDQVQLAADGPVDGDRPALDDDDPYGVRPLRRHRHRRDDGQSRDMATDHRRVDPQDRTTERDGRGLLDRGNRKPVRPDDLDLGHGEPAGEPDAPYREKDSGGEQPGDGCLDQPPSTSGLPALLEPRDRGTGRRRRSCLDRATTTHGHSLSVSLAKVSGPIMVTSPAPRVRITSPGRPRSRPAPRPPPTTTARIPPARAAAGPPRRCSRPTHRGSGPPPRGTPRAPRRGRPGQGPRRTPDGTMPYACSGAAGRPRPAGPRRRPRGRLGGPRPARSGGGRSRRRRVRLPQRPSARTGAGSR